MPSLALPLARRIVRPIASRVDDATSEGVGVNEWLFTFDDPDGTEYFLAFDDVDLTEYFLTGAAL